MGWPLHLHKFFEDTVCEIKYSVYDDKLTITVRLQLEAWVEGSTTCLNAGDIKLCFYHVDANHLDERNEGARYSTYISLVFTEDGAPWHGRNISN